MLPDKISFVDIETTGTSISYSRIIEIGILKIQNKKLIKKYQSLINPEISIDPFIEQFTGISQKDIEKAPTFYDLKEEILELLTDSVFVAHNVRFDYGFLRNEFKRYDISFSSKHFCTVKLARLLYPELKNYHLDSIIENFNLKCQRRHRAFDDAKVLWDFYKKSYKNFDKKRFVEAVNIALRRPSVPLNISPKVLDDLPETCGVYIFYGQDGAPLYIGKSLNIKDRVLSHFSGDYLSSIDMKISQTIKNIETITTAGELGALFLESTLIKKYQPLYNRKLRQAYKLLAATKIRNEKNYNFVKVTNLDEVDVKNLSDVIGVFRSEKQLKNTLYELADDHNLCHKLMGLEKTQKTCFAYHLGKCFGACGGSENYLKYNLRFDEAFYKHKIKSWPYQGPITIKEKGDSEEIFLIDKWCYLGSWKGENDSYRSLKKDYIFDYDTYRILIRYLLGKNTLNLSYYPTPNP